MTGVSVGRRRKVQVVYVAALTAVWLLLWGDVSVANILSGALIAVVLVLALPMPPIPYAGRIRLVPLIKLVVKFFIDLFSASLQVAWQVIDIRKQPRSVIVLMNLRSDSDLYLTMTANMESLVPGTLAIDLRRPSSTLVIHMFGVHGNVDDRIAAVRAQEARILAAFASDEELARAYPFEQSALSEGRQP
jgi:multicomponent Na+:H+ antiporter subunit E